MKISISAIVLSVIFALTGCKDIVPTKSSTPTVTPVAKFDCVPETQADFIGGRLVRERNIYGDVTKLKITGGAGRMHLTINDTHINAVREFYDSEPAKESDGLLFNTKFDINGKSYAQSVMLPADAHAQSRFFYQRMTGTVSTTDGQTLIAVVMGGYCQRTGTI